MNKTDIFTIFILLITFLYAIALYYILQRLKIKSSLQGIAIASPGIIMIITLYGWLIGIPLKILIIGVVVISVFIVVYSSFVLSISNWLNRFTSIRNFRKNSVSSLVLRKQKKGMSAKETQERGLIPTNKKLLEFGFSEEELKKLGLLD